MPQHSAEHDAINLEKPKNKKVKPLVIIIAILVIVIIAALFIVKLGQSNNVSTTDENLSVYEVEYDGNRRINWGELQDRNSSVYAWIEIPGTRIDEPVLQHPMADDFFLTHSIDGETAREGALYTQISWNSTDFTQDKVTVIYGHTFEDNDSMFTNLHYFEDPEFFNTHDEFYIYTPTSKLTYKIVSAFEYDSRHILETNDGFKSANKLQTFFDMLLNPASEVQNVREMDAPITTDDNVVILSTCTKPADSSKRYLVAGVLEDQQDVL